MDFKVVLADLTSMASGLHTRAADYRALHPQLTPAVAAGGDPGLDHAISEAAHLISALHTLFADRLDDHGDKVAYARDSFHRHDIDVHGLFEDLMKGEG
ncbi:hypothetical protein IAG44_10555 [Streptomyces roseirectus]|uniref:Uncharacterized protein n=1 Tax=Streptomyces roseirectus TaxID=2768066 RepID=A0A7H0IAM7_9ACTN|nr:DUF6317 family protein [Streptomyces roseirectus]QNP69843.1 hypothetical protein IAG44_10555 [Streptomyces roseirectus]